MSIATSPHPGDGLRAAVLIPPSHGSAATVRLTWHLRSGSVGMLYVRVDGSPKVFMAEVSGSGSLLPHFVQRHHDYAFVLHLRHTTGRPVGVAYVNEP